MEVTSGSATVAEPAFGFVAGHLALDFINTVDWRTSSRPEERLRRYSDLVAWGRQAGILTGSQAATLLEAARQQPERATAAVATAVSLRETLFRVSRALSDNRQPEPADLQTFNRLLTWAMARVHLVAAGDGTLRWDWAPDPSALDRMLWPVVRAAAELFTSQQVELVGMCAGPGCGWLFLDTTKNRRRKWCSMQDCGNRAKARRFHARRKKAKETAGGSHAHEGPEGLTGAPGSA